MKTLQPLRHHHEKRLAGRQGASSKKAAVGPAAWCRARLLGFLLVAFALCGAAAPGIADASGTLYVTVGGSDQSSSCSQPAPCGSISHALAVAGSGDTIQVGGGEFDENVVIPGTLDPVTIQGSGADETIVRGAMPSDSNPRPGPVFTIEPGTRASINDLSITGGSGGRGGG